MTTREPDAADVEAGQRIYTPLVLRAYDLLALGFSNRFAWHCPSERMLERDDRHIGRRHLDLGVGTGWYLDRCTWPSSSRITLLDLNRMTGPLGLVQFVRGSKSVGRQSVGGLRGEPRL